MNIKDIGSVFLPGQFEYFLETIKNKLNCYINTFDYYKNNIVDAAGMTAFNSLCYDTPNTKVLKVFAGIININANVDIGSGKAFLADIYSPSTIITPTDLLEGTMRVQDAVNTYSMNYLQESIIAYKMTNTLSAPTATSKFSMVMNGFIFDIIKK